MAISPLDGFESNVTRNVTVQTGSGVTHLSLTGRTANKLDIASSSGADVSIPAATTALAGLLAAAVLRTINDNKSKLDTIQRGATPNAAIGDIANDLFMLPNINNFNDNDRSRLDTLTDAYIRSLIPAAPSVAGLLNRMQVLSILQAAAGTGLTYNSQSNTLNVSGTGGADTHRTHYRIAGISDDSTFTASELTVTSQNANIVLPTYSGNRYIAIGVEANTDAISDLEIGGFSVLTSFERVPGTIAVGGRTYIIYRSDEAGNLSGETIRVLQ